MSIIGIDLGTSNSAAAVLRGGRPVIIPSAEGVSLGGKAFPSYVAVTADGQMLVGEPARRQAAANPEGTATAFKRRMGQRETIRLRDKSFTPEQLSAFLLQKIKRDAEAFLGEAVSQAVVTVPAYFDDKQREGADLWRQEWLPLTDAVLGTKLKVSTLDGGNVEVDIPAGIQPDTVLRLREKGLPHFGGKGRGDLFLQVKLSIPEKLSREERELYERLRALTGKTQRHFWE